MAELDPGRAEPLPTPKTRPRPSTLPSGGATYFAIFSKFSGLYPLWVLSVHIKT